MKRLSLTCMAACTRGVSFTAGVQVAACLGRARACHLQLALSMVLLLMHWTHGPPLSTRALALGVAPCQLGPVVAVSTGFPVQQRVHTLCAVFITCVALVAVAVAARSYCPAAGFTVATTALILGPSRAKTGPVDTIVQYWNNFDAAAGERG